MNLKGKNILITGGTGFLGGATEKAFQKEIGNDTIIEVIGSKDYDLRLFRDAEKATENRDLVVHLAADCGGIGYNRENPGKLFYGNMAMGINVIEACRRNAVKKIVLIGSVCGYPKYTKVPFREEDLFLGYPEETNAPYGLAKRELLTLAQGYRQQYGMNAIYLLIVNLYGPHDAGFWHPEKSHVIPALIAKFLTAKVNKENVTLWGTGSPTREFLYVDDAAEAIVLASRLYDKPHPVNVGAGFEISIRELAEMIKELVGYEGEIVWDETHPDGQPRRCLNVEKAKEFFNFEAATKLKEGLRKTVNWYLEKKGL